MIRSTLLALAVLLASCAPSHDSQTFLPGLVKPQGPFTVSIVSGDNQTGPAVQSLVGAVTSQSGPNTFTINYPPGTAPGGPNAKPLAPLVVLVLDVNGKPAPNVLVDFEGEWDSSQGPSYYSPKGYLVGPAGLGSVDTDSQGLASVDATPYMKGPQHATAHVDASAGQSNTCIFTETGQ